MAENHFEGVAPVLRVASVRAAIAYYVERLGFQFEWGNESFASVARDRCHIFLSSGDQGNPGSWVWVGVEDAAALEAEYRAKGAKIRHPGTNYPWAFEMQVEDLDGNALRCGSESIEGRPFGEWLDMYGRVWPGEPSK